MRCAARFVCGLAFVAPALCPLWASADHILLGQKSALLSGSVAYVQSADRINVHVDYAVFGPGPDNLPAFVTANEFGVLSASQILQYPFADSVTHLQDLAGQYVYAYEIFNQGETSVTGFSVPYDTGVTITGRGVADDNGIAPQLIQSEFDSSGTHGATKFMFFSPPGEIVKGAQSQLLLISSPQGPGQLWGSYIMAGGGMPNSDLLFGAIPAPGYSAVPVPNPTTFLGGSVLITVLLIGKFPRRANCC